MKRGRAHQIEWLDRLEREHDNLRSALSWMLDHDNPETGLRLACSLSWFWEVRGYLSEGRAGLERAMAVAENAPASLRAAALSNLSSIAHVQGDYASAVPWAQESLVLYQQLGDTRAVARTLLGLAWTLLHRGDAVTLPLFEEALGLCRELGDERGIAEGLMGIGRIAVLENDLERGARLRDEALALARGIGDEWLMARGTYGVAWTALALGDLRKAQAHYEESLGFLHKIGDRWGLAVALEGLAGVAAGSGEVRHAAQLLGAASAIRADIGADSLSSDRGHSQHLLDNARKQLGEQEWRAAWDEGRVMPNDRALAYALEPAINS